MSATVSTGRIRVPVWACADCGTALPRRTQDRQGKLPGIDRGRQSVGLVLTEAEVEEQTDAACAAHGWPNLSTVRRVKFRQCPHCGRWSRPPGNDGADRGVPDRLILPGFLPPHLGILVELKGTHTPYSSPEQEALCESGRIAVARSGEEVQAIVEGLRATLAGARLEMGT